MRVSIVEITRVSSSQFS